MYYYQSCLRFHTTTDLTPAEVHQIGLSEVARISGEIEKVRAAADLKKLHVLKYKAASLFALRSRSL